MLISDALPVQFWLTGVPTFNNSVFNGVVRKCFSQIFNGSDEIRFQFVDDAAANYDLLVYDAITDEQLDTIPFVATGAPLVWELAIAAVDYLDKVVYFTIVDHDAPATVFATSGPVDIQTNHPLTELIQYSNEQNYAGLDYTDSEVFSLRVKAKFFMEQLPEESESEPLSNGSVVKLSSSVKSQKFFEVEPVPFFMQKKIKLAILHNTVNIGGELWTEEGGYETKQLDERFAFYSGKVWLTKEDDSFVTNVFGQTTEIV